VVADFEKQIHSMECRTEVLVDCQHKSKENSITEYAETDRLRRKSAESYETGQNERRFHGQSGTIRLTFLGAHEDKRAIAVNPE
jgi:ribosomal protein L21E